MKNLICLMLLASSILSAQNSSLRFDGNAEYVSIPHKSQFNVGESYTIEAWIFANNWKAQSWQGSILNKDKPGPDSGFAFRCGNGGQLSFVMSADGKWNEIISPAVMNEKQWHHVAVVIEDPDMKLYLDGQLIASAQYEGSPSPNSSELRIGASPGFGSRHFDGFIDEVRIWGVARTGEEIAENKTNSLTGEEDGLLALFPMNDGSGTVVSNLVDPMCNGSTKEMDNSNWSQGYQLPDYDLSVLGLYGIDRVSMKTRPITFTASVQNVGTKSVENFNVEVYVDGKLVFVEEVEGEIKAGEVVDYEIIQSIDLTDLKDPLISVKAVIEEDNNSLNDFASERIKTRDGNIVNLFFRDQHNFGSAGQNQFSTVTLPNDLFEYDKLLLHISVDCPFSGCDPWDQPASLTIMTEDGPLEIARYITPFGKACGPWTIDVSDFKSVLGGTVDYNSYIQVWGQSGWLLTVDLELVKGDDQLEFSKLQNLWQSDYQVYGDPAISYDLEEHVVTIDERTERSHVRMQVSGHGQGNTNNAAEFSEFTHVLNINKEKWADHHLWKDDCGANLCSNQLGTWLFARAGWCPGQELKPMIFNLGSEFNGTGELKLDYVLDDYTNLLNTGYNDGSHTEPHYRIHGYFIETSSEIYDTSYFNLTANTLTPNITGEGNGQVLEYVDFNFSNTSYQAIPSLASGEAIVRLYINGNLASEVQDLAIYSLGDFNVRIEGDEGFIPGGNNTFVAEIKYSKDVNPGDNFVKTLVQGTSSLNDLSSDAFMISPNPTSRLINIQLEDELQGGEVLLMSVDGKVLHRQKIFDKKYVLEVEQAGIYLLHVVNLEGKRATKRIVVVNE